MPIKSAKMYGLMAMKAHGGGQSGIGPSPEVAEEMLHKTPAKTRSSFAKIIAKKRKKK